MTGPDLAAWRQQHGLRVEQVARLFGVHRSMIYRWQEGSVPMPGPAQRLLGLLQQEMIYQYAASLYLTDAAHNNGRKV
jgi:DNA-binding transcriptional regulator YiaG